MNRANCHPAVVGMGVRASIPMSNPNYPCTWLFVPYSSGGSMLAQKWCFVQGVQGVQSLFIILKKKKKKKKNKI
jgi:hypothetical protein